MLICDSASHMFTLAALLLLVSGCASAPSNLAATKVTASGIGGQIHGGQQPVAGATVQIYAVGTTGDGSPATPLLSPAVTSTAAGNFTIPAFICPSGALLYIVGTGGYPAPGVANPQLSLMVAAGSCSALAPPAYFAINEQTTVAAAYALAPFTSSLSAIGSGSSDASALAAAFTLAGELVNPATGMSPGAAVPSGYTAPSAQIATLANILANCVNSSGGLATNTTTPCGLLFSLTPSAAGANASDTFMAAVNLAGNPTANTAALYQSASATPPYAPGDLTQPASFSAALTPSAGTLAVSTAQALVPNIPGGFAMAFTPPAPYGPLPGAIIVTNTGGTAVTISSITLSTTAIVETNNCVGTLAPGAACAVVTISGNSTPSTSTLTINSNASNPSVAVTLYSGATGQFGAVAVGSSGTAQTISLKGAFFVSLTGPAAGDFIRTQTSTFTFHPTAAGPRFAILNTESSGTPIVQELLYGFGVPAGNANAVTTGSLGFAQTADNTTTAAQTLTVANPAGHPLTLQVASLDANSGTPPFFNLSSNLCLATSCTISVTYSPLYVESDLQYLTAVDTVTGSNINGFLSGTGGVYNVAANPTSVNFGGLAVNTTSSPQSVTLTATGDMPAQTNAVLSDSTGTFSFSNGQESIDKTTTIGPITFRPNAYGTFSASIGIKNAFTGAVLATIPLTGSGLSTLTGFPSNVNFRTFNNLGFNPTNNNNQSIATTLTLTGSSDYSLSTYNCVPSLAANASCGISVTPLFPAHTTPNSGTVATLTFTATGLPTETVPIYDSLGYIYSYGGTPLSTASSNAPSFTDYLNTSSKTYSAISQFFGPDAQDFSIYTPSTCTPNSTSPCTRQVFFTPTASGVRTAVFSWSNPNSSLVTNTVLYGIGTANPGASAAFVPPPSYTNLIAHTGSANSFTLTLVNDGSTTLSIPSLSALTGTGSKGGTLTPTATTCGSTLSTGSQCTVTYSYTQTTSLQEVVHLTFTDAASNQAFDTYLYESVVSP